MSLVNQSKKYRTLLMSQKKVLSPKLYVSCGWKDGSTFSSGAIEASPSSLNKCSIKHKSIDTCIKETTNHYTNVLSKMDGIEHDSYVKYIHQCCTHLQHAELCKDVILFDSSTSKKFN